MDNDYAKDLRLRRVYHQSRQEPGWIQDNFLKFEKDNDLRNYQKVSRRDINKIRESGQRIWSRVSTDYIFWFVEDGRRLYEES